VYKRPARGGAFFDMSAIVFEKGHGRYLDVQEFGMR